MPGGMIPTQSTPNEQIPIGEKVDAEAQPSDFLSNLTLQGADKFHEALTTVNDTNQQMQVRDEQNWVSKTLMNTRLNFLGRISDMRANPDSAPSPADFQGEIQDYIDKVGAQAPNGRARDMLNNEMDQLTPRLMAPVFGLATKNAIAARSTGIASTVDSGFDVAAADPSQMPAVHAQLTSMLGTNKGSISSVDYQTLGQKINQLPAATVDSVAQTNPAAATQMLDHPLVQSTMTPDAIEAAKTRYEASIGTGKKSAQAILGDQATNAIAALRDTGTFPAGFNPQALAHVATPKQYETFLDNAYVATTMHKNDAQVQAASLGDLTKMQEEMPTAEAMNSNDPFLSREQKILTQTRDSIKSEITTLNTDGYAASMRDPQVSNYFKQADAMAKSDPEKLGGPIAAAMELAPGTPQQAKLNQDAQDIQVADMYQKGFQASIAYQANRGIPADQQKVMSKSDAIDSSNSIMKADNFKDVSKALSDMQTKFGPYFPQAVAQMHSLPGSSSLPAGIGAVASNLDQPYAEALFNAIKTPEGGDKDEDAASFKSQFKQIGKPTVDTDIDSKVAQQETFSNLREVQNNGNAGDAGTRYTADLQTAVSKMAKYIYLHPPIGREYDADQAAKLATDTVVGQHLAFRESNGVQFVVPRDPVPNQHYDDADVDHIQDGLQSEVDKIHATFTGPDKTPYEINRGESIAAKNYWVTSGNNQGAYLFRKANDLQTITNQGVQLFDGGKPVYRSFEDMRQKGVLMEQQRNSEIQPMARAPGAIFQS